MELIVAPVVCVHSFLNCPADDTSLIKNYTQRRGCNWKLWNRGAQMPWGTSSELCNSSWILLRSAILLVSTFFVHVSQYPLDEIANRAQSPFDAIAQTKLRIYFKRKNEGFIQFSSIFFNVAMSFTFPRRIVELFCIFNATKCSLHSHNATVKFGERKKVRIWIIYVFICTLHFPFNLLNKCWRANAPRVSSREWNRNCIVRAPPAKEKDEGEEEQEERKENESEKMRLIRIFIATLIILSKWKILLINPVNLFISI